MIVPAPPRLPASGGHHPSCAASAAACHPSLSGACSAPLASSWTSGLEAGAQTGAVVGLESRRLPVFACRGWAWPPRTSRGSASLLLCLGDGGAPLSWPPAGTPRAAFGRRRARRPTSTSPQHQHRPPRPCLCLVADGDTGRGWAAPGPGNLVLGCVPSGTLKGRAPSRHGTLTTWHPSKTWFAAGVRRPRWPSHGARRRPWLPALRRTWRSSSFPGPAAE
jgi:hypothetical protein